MMCGQARFVADLLQGIQDRLVCILRAASVLQAGVDVITVRVYDVLTARQTRVGGGWLSCWLDLSASSCWRASSSS